MPLLASELKVLERLARAGPRSYQELLADLKNEVRSNKTILYSLRKLEFLHLIRGSKAENRSTGVVGRPATVYRITLNGLLALLLLREIDPQLLNDIAGHNKGLLPLIFGRWEFFKQNNVLDIACKLMENAVAEEANRTLRVLNLQLNLWEKAKKSFGEMIYMPITKISAIFERFGIEVNGSIKQMLQIAEKIDDTVEALEVQSFQKRFYFPTLKVPEGYQLFLQTCGQDQEIRKFIIGHLDEMEKTYFDILEKIQFLKKLFSKEGSVI